MPELRGFNFAGGWTIAPEYFALLIALVTYTSAFIAEIVRSGIQSVHKGQWDAAVALVSSAASCFSKSSCRRRCA